MNIDYLKQLMLSHGTMTIGQLSLKSGVSKSQISRILSGKRGVGKRTIDGIRKAFPEADLNRLLTT